MGNFINSKGREYISGVDRSSSGMYKLTHLYDGYFNDTGLPMCKRGYNRGDGYSIFRNNISKKGYCKKCKQRAEDGLDGV